MSNVSSLGAAAEDRKAHLARLRSLKRKQPTTATGSGEEVDENGAIPNKRRSPTPEKNAASVYLSGRNYDAEARGPKLGFDSQPAEGQDTVEAQAEILAEATRKQAEEEDKADKPLDLLKLQPKKPNWDLKRDLDRKLQVLNVRTDNAIARLVRERIQNAQRAAREKNDTNGEGEVVGLDGVSLVEATHVLEREEAEDEKREAEDEDEDV